METCDGIDDESDDESDDDEKGAAAARAKGAKRRAAIIKAIQTQWQISSRHHSQQSTKEVVKFGRVWRSVIFPAYYGFRPK